MFCRFLQIFCFFISCPILSLTILLQEVLAHPAPPVKFFASSSVVAIDEKDISTLYNFLAMVPAAIFTSEGTVYASLLTTDSTHRANRYLIQDWKKVVPQKMLEWTLAGETKKFAEESGIDCSRVFRGNPFTIADRIARSRWISSKKAVITIFRNTPSKDDILSAANAAVLASIKNCPLLYTEKELIPPGTMSVLDYLGVREVILVEIGDSIGEKVITQLNNAGLHVEADCISLAELVPAIIAEEKPVFIAFIQDNFQAMGASLAAARYHGFVSFIPENICREVRKAEEIARTLPHQSEKLAAPLPPAPSMEKAEQEVADSFYSWAISTGAFSDGFLETIVTFAPVETFSPCFERALAGDPSHPAFPGAFTARMPGSPQLNVTFTNRGYLYPLLIHANPRPDTITMSMVAYEVQNPSPSCQFGPFISNDGLRHTVNELTGCRNSLNNDPGIYIRFLEESYRIKFHNSPVENPEGVDPVNKEKLSGFIKDIAKGSVFLYISGNGLENAILVPPVDTGLETEIPYSSPLWPSARGRVNFAGEPFTADLLDRQLGSCRSSIVAFNSCLAGAGPLNQIFLEHGAAATISSYVSVSFDGSGYFWCLFVNKMLEKGVTLGEAYGLALAATSTIIPPRIPGVDNSLKYVIFGDPFIEFIKTDWLPSEPEGAGVINGHII